MTGFQKQLKKNRRMSTMTNRINIDWHVPEISPRLFVSYRDEE